MGCWFACLRFRAEQRTPLSSVDTTPCKSRDRLVSRKRLASVFAPEGKGSPCKGDAVQGSADWELKHEADFLKSCGALLETPAEITKASQKTNNQHKNQDGIPKNSHFPLRDSSCKELQWDEQLEEAPCSPAPLPKGCLADSACDLTPSMKQHIVRTYSSIVHSGTPISLGLAAEIWARSVPFEVVQDGSGAESDMHVSSKATPQNGSHSHSPSSTYSPYPTPLNLTDEIETPGTVYPAKAENYGFGKNARIRSQYIYPVLNPMTHRPRMARSEASHHVGQSDELPEQQVQDANPPDGGPKLQSCIISVYVDSVSPLSDKPFNLRNNHANREPALPDNVRSNVGSESTISCSAGESSDREQDEVSSGRPALVVSSFSQWNGSTDQHEGRLNSEAATRGQSPISSSPDRDRPIIEMVAAHWNSGESARVSPNLWDGNGIPNLTNKYKEDQRVSWHATPFEERLEKALSDEKLHPYRKLPSGKPSELEEGDEERDTATS